ncbi:selenide, water dikinase SelD [Calditerricola satsumensis]|uniref:Selenide, water dikinase n=1 Tax=Calditerricola satsumensis TaxID=373054 RepID=A0A8J3B736_9BACI|nr:selenide, water dikinase [Calditerricola satsumensis]
MLRHLPRSEGDPRLLVGFETSDDAGVFRLTDDMALVQTVDYFTPIVDDPYWFGAIAAANALSDVYAMGGKPLTALNIVGFPIKKLDPAILADILRGAAEKVREAGATLVGGHSIDDQEPKFGLAVTGVVHPDKVWRNCGACPGDKLILTKPIGVGVLTTAIKRDRLDEEGTRRVTEVMATLNKAAAEVLASFSVHACTDVTGFGLLGHAYEMAAGSGVGLRIEAERVPILPGARELAAEGIVPGGSRANAQWLADKVDFADGVDEATRLVLCDAVTSGGLLVALPAAEADAALEALRKGGVEAALVGEAVAEQPGRIRVVP